MLRIDKLTVRDRKYVVLSSPNTRIFLKLNNDIWERATMEIYNTEVAPFASEVKIESKEF